MAAIKIELPDIRSALEEILLKKNITNYVINLSVGSKKGDNYMGEVYGVEIIGMSENGESVTLRLFCKIPPQSIARREYSSSHEAFIREITFYNEILPIFQKIQLEKNLANDLFDSYASCCAWSTADLKEFLIMEDLRAQNYVMFDKQKKLDVDHCRLALKQLAKFHALSFAVKDQKMELIEKFKSMVDVVGVRNYFSKNLEGVVKNSITFFVGEERYRKILVDSTDNWVDKIISCVDGQKAEPYAVINHGDFWNNNMLFKYENGNPVNIKFLDWQLARYASPALDILYYIFTCTDAEFRKEHYDSLIRLYHDNLSEFLIRLGSDPDKLFPYSALQDQLKKFGFFALGMSLLVLPLIIAGKDDAPDFDKVSELVKADPSMRDKIDIHSSRTKSVFTERVTGIIQDLIKLDYNIFKNSDL